MTFLKYKGFYLTLGIASIILFLSLQPHDEGGAKIVVFDKLLHFIAYGIMVLPVSLGRMFNYYTVFLFALVFGGCIELIQPLTGREADKMDLWANTAGITFGILIAK